RVVATHGTEHETGPFPPPVAPRGESSSGAFDLVPLSEGNALAIYLDRFIPNQPIGSASIEVETPSGPVTASTQPGDVYRIEAPWLATAGKYDLIFTVTAGGEVDVLPVTLEVPAPETTGDPAEVTRPTPSVLLTGAAAAGFVLAVVLMSLFRRRPGAIAAIATLVLCSSVLAHEGHEHGPPAPPAGGRDVAQRLPDGSLFVPKATQRILAIRTTMTAEAQFARTVELPGRIIPDPNASRLVPAAAGGP